MKSVTVVTERKNASVVLEWRVATVIQMQKQRAHVVNNTHIV